VVVAIAGVIVSVVIVIRPALKSTPPIVVIIVTAIGEARGAFDDLVEFSSVQPDTAALRTEINLHALTIADREVDLTPWTFHLDDLLHCIHCDECAVYADGDDEIARACASGGRGQSHDATMDALRMSMITAREMPMGMW
jgi:hypothetical protein